MSETAQNGIEPEVEPGTEGGEENGKGGLRRKTISWTGEEVRLLATAIAQRRIADPLPSLTSIYKELEQEILPPDRQRAMATVTLHEELFVQVREECRRIMAAQSIEIPVVIPIAAEVVPAELTAKLTDAELIHEGANRIIRLLEMASMKVNRANIAAIAIPPPARVVKVEPKEKKHVKPTVAIIGPMQSHFDIIKDKTKDLGFELIFMDKDRRYSTPPQADFIIIQSRFISHKHVQQIKSNESMRDRIIELDPTAGINSICKALAEIKAKLGMDKAAK